MEERRKLERFGLNSPARLQIIRGSGKPEKLDLTTKDISSDGAFLFAHAPIPEGANVKIDFFISLDTLRKISGEEGSVRVRVNGKVIRTNQDGIAIRFDSKYKITALSDTID